MYDYIYIVRKGYNSIEMGTSQQKLEWVTERIDTPETVMTTRAHT